MDRIRGMSGIDIASCLRGVDNFNGAFAYDQLPPLINEGYYIVNSATIASGGEHWLAMYIPSDRKTAEYFDSFAMKPSYYNRCIERVLFANAERYTRNIKRLQAPGSSLCGQYCVLYCYLGSKHGFSLDDYMKVFGENYSRNDSIVEFWQKCPR